MGLFSFFKKKEDNIELTDEGLIEVGVCPNCWGHSEYAGQFVEYVKDRQRDIINKDATAQKAFIQKFVEERITGIRLVNSGEKSACPVCTKI